MSGGWDIDKMSLSQIGALAILPDVPDGKATGSTKSVLCVLCARADKAKQQCWPSIENIARDAMVTENTARTALKLLRRMGAIRISESKHTSCVYTVDRTWLFARIAPSRGAAIAPLKRRRGLQPLLPRGATIAPQGGQPLSPRGPMAGPEQVDEQVHRTNPGTRETRAREKTSRPPQVTTAKFSRPAHVNRSQPTQQPLSAEWRPAPETVERIKTRHPHLASLSKLQHQLDRFRDWKISKGKTSFNWDREFSLWCDNPQAKADSDGFNG